MLKIFYEKEPEDEDFYLRLVPHGKGGINLVVVDKDGVPRHCANILHIGPKGVTVFSGVNPEFGIAQDDAGRVNVIKE